MSAQAHEHAAPTAHDAEAPHGHAFDSPEEVAHAKEHRTGNNKIFFVFFVLLLCAVLSYEFFGTDNPYIFFFWAFTRVALIAYFFFWLFHQFSLIVRTFVFTVFFFMGMIWLSMFDSPLPRFGNPISNGSPQSLFQPKPVPAAKPPAPANPLPAQQP
jgi:hypothetical protein